MKKSINAKKIQTEFERICELYPKCEGVVMSHDKRNVWVTVYTEGGLSEYKFDETYLEGEE